MDRQNTATFVLFVAVVAVLLDDQVAAMTASEKNGIKLKVLEMFDHAYGSYMNHAYPADELMPLSCKGRYKGTEPSRGDIDDTLGNFTLTLIDSLDTLAVLGKVEEFEQAVRLVIRDARFDCDTIVSVFETNIRVLGGLLGGHVVASYLKKKGRSLLWYNSELLEMAREVGDRLLPAFNTSTGIPYPRINLKKGIAESIFSQSRDTCTACAGTMLLEFAALSRLTGDPKYEEKARKAMDYLWQQRHRTSDLMGLVINIHNGDWIRRESGVGAGFDSYYEYVLKSYILLGDETYLDRFNKHYDAVMRYVSQGPLLIDVHMHKPMAASRNFMDALLAFWPGLQVLKGDIGPAVETHEMLYQVIQRHNFLPEAFTNDFRIHWSHHPLRPEFVESTYFLFKATGDHHYLDVGRQVVENLDKLARVPCGFAALKDVTTNRHEDQMDSYVLAETFKYLFLLFAEKEDLILNIDDYIFTTEAHILPLTLSVHNSTQVPKIRPEAYSNLESIHSTTQTSEVHPKTSAMTPVSDGEEYNMCPNFQGNIAAGSNYAEDLRSSLKNLVNKVSPRQPQRDGVRIHVSTVKDGKKLTQTIHPKPQRMRQRLLAAEFIAGNKDHLDILHQMGIRIATMSDGRIQLLHTASEAATPEDAEDGMKFMQEMIELSKTQSPETQHDPMYVQLLSAPFYGSVYYKAGPAQFGYDLKVRSEIQGKLGISSPFRACKTLTNPQHVDGKIALLERGDCMFVDKARNLQKAGAIGGIVIDQNEGSTSESQTLFAMSGDGQSDISIPLVFLFKKEGAELIRALSLDNNLEIVLTRETRPTAFNKPQPIPPTGPKVPPFPNDNPEDLDSDNIPNQVPPMHGEPLTRAEGGERIGLDEVYTYQTNSQNVRLQIKVTGEMDTSTFNEVLEEGEVSEEENEGEGDTLNQVKNVLQLDTLPDGSKQLSFQIEKKLESGKNQPELNQIYVDLVQTLQDTTNFERLNNQGDYLIAIARFLESAYFGLDRVDGKAQELIEKLSQELKFLQDKSPVQAVEGNLKQEHMDFEKAKELHYASASELYETTSETRSDDHKQYVTTEESDGGFGARVNEDGVLVFKVEQDNSLSQESIESDPHSSNDLLDDSEFVPSSIEVETKGGFLKTTERNEKGEVVRTSVRSVDPSHVNQHIHDSQVTEETGNIEGSEEKKQKDEL